MTGLDGVFAERYGQAWSAPDSDLLLGFFAPQAVYEDVGTHRVHRGHHEIAAFYRAMLAFSSDSEIVFESPAGCDGRFALPWIWSGTNSGPLVLDGRRYEPSGRRFSVRGIAWCTTDEDGLLTLHRGFYDVHAMLRELGLLESAPRELAERAYAALAMGDEPGLLSVLADDFRACFAHGMPVSAGEHAGAEAARDAWWGIGARFGVRAEPEEFIPCSDGRLLVRGHYRGSARRDGAGALDAAFMHLWTARRGRLVTLEQLTDTARWVP